jgi:hypothetical protein
MILSRRDVSHFDWLAGVVVVCHCFTACLISNEPSNRAQEQQRWQRIDTTCRATTMQNNNQLPWNDGSGRTTTTRRIISAVRTPSGRSSSLDDGVTAQRRGVMKTRRTRNQPSATYDWAMVRSGRIIVVIIILTISACWIVSTFATRHDDRRRILIFDTTQLSNQGAGNLLTGLYAAHLLGVEFHRTVCTVYPDLLVHFAPSLQQQEQEDCHSTRMTIHHRRRQQQQQQRQEEERLVILDYQITDECHVQRVLASSVPVVVLSGNTYPRWPRRRRPSGQPRLNFLDWYRPRPEFLLRYFSIINNSSSTASSTTTPTTPPATVVVHLRSPDDVTFDPREGLDEASLRQMEQLIVGVAKNTNTSDRHTNNIFLVTNNVSLYQRFAKCCHWSHANWDVVAHSANGVVWDNHHRTVTSSTKSSSSSSSTTTSQNHHQHRPQQQGRQMSSSAHNDRGSQHQQQNFQLWSDWYTIYRADIVYHTRSAFSQSAHRWATGSGGGRPDDDDDHHRPRRQRPPQQSFVFAHGMADS